MKAKALQLRLENVSIKAELGDLASIRELGRVRHSNPDLMRWVIKRLKISASNGHSEANYQLGRLFRDKCVPMNSSINAQFYFRVAAEQNHRDAQYEFALYHENKDDLKEYEMWLRKAANQGHVEAAYLIGCIDFFDSRNPGSDSNAVLWWIRAAKAGHKLAQEKIGYCYWEGKGLKKDLVEAYAWLGMASSHNPALRLLCDDVLSKLGAKYKVMAKARLEKYRKHTLND